jgi:hypothetical protein
MESTKDDLKWKASKFDPGEIACLNEEYELLDL